MLKKNIRKKIFILQYFLLILFFSNCKAKSSEKSTTIHDTIVVEKVVNRSLETDGKKSLSGTIILIASDRNMNSRWVYGVNLVELSSSECLEAQSETPASTEIKFIKQLNDTVLIISANIDANCGYSFLGEVEIVSENTINLISHGYGSYASCNCCFGLTYKIALIKDQDYKFDKLKYVTINGIEKKTLPKIR